MLLVSFMVIHENQSNQIPYVNLTEQYNQKNELLPHR